MPQSPKAMWVLLLASNFSELAALFENFPHSDATIADKDGNRACRNQESQLRVGPEVIDS